MQGGWGSIPGQGTRSHMPQLRPVQQKKKEEEEEEEVGFLHLIFKKKLSV